MEINGVLFQSGMMNGNGNRNRKTTPGARGGMPTNGNKKRNNWLWWRRMEVAPRADVEKATEARAGCSGGGGGGGACHVGGGRLYRVEARREQARAQAQVQNEKKMVDENEKGPNIFVAFWGFLSSWARVERDGGMGRRA